jgi:hypothetical protein
MNVATVAPLSAAALMRADAMRVLVWLRPTMARFAPSAASASPAANPMPLVAPVIRICLLLRARLFKAMPSADDLSDGLGLALDQPPANGASGPEFCCEHRASPRGIAAEVRTGPNPETCHVRMDTTAALAAGTSTVISRLSRCATSLVAGAHAPNSSTLAPPSVMPALASAAGPASRMTDEATKLYWKEPICFSRHLYCARNLVERFFNKITPCRHSLRQARCQLPCLHPACFHPAMATR